MQNLMKLQNGSDIRGIACEGVAGEEVNLTPEAGNLIGQAFAIWLGRKKQKAVTDLRIGIGHDSRITAQSLYEAVAKGLTVQGATAYYCGLVSTPSMFMTTVFEEFAFDGAIMITASHLPFNRNGVLFPRKINGNYYMLSRPSDNGHTPFGDIFVSESPDMKHWGVHRYVMGTIKGDESAWQSTKIGAGCIPIETEEGWLVIYHGVINTCNGFVYRMGCALLDLEQPWKVLKRTKNYILAPHEIYECMGDVPNVVFPCAALTDAETGRIAIYYGCADTVTGLAFTTVNELMESMESM